MNALIFLFSCFLALYPAQKNSTIEDFTLNDAVNKENVSLSSFNNKKLVAVVFTSNYCPYAKLYDERLINLQNKYAEQGVQFLLINSNDPKASPEDSEEKMMSKAKAMSYPFPYLLDKEQKAAGILGAQKTPEAFLLAPAANGFKVIYQGAIDDNPQSAKDVKSPYFQMAIDNALQNQKISQAYARPTGCLIRGN